MNGLDLEISCGCNSAAHAYDSEKAAGLPSKVQRPPDSIARTLRAATERALSARKLIAVMP
jgi:hypothetical protein